jgi:hypothetical protein
MCAFDTVCLLGGGFRNSRMRRATACGHFAVGARANMADETLQRVTAGASGGLVSCVVLPKLPCV